MRIPAIEGHVWWVSWRQHPRTVVWKYRNGRLRLASLDSDNTPHLTEDLTFPGGWSYVLTLPPPVYLGPPGTPPAHCPWGDV